jgi:hypothetical protein
VAGATRTQTGKKENSKGLIHCGTVPLLVCLQSEQGERTEGEIECQWLYGVLVIHHQNQKQIPMYA